VSDNPALFSACKRSLESDDCDRVEALFIATPGQWREHNMAPLKADFIYRSVLSLQADLASLGIRLKLVYADRFSEVPALIADMINELNIGFLYLNQEYALNETRRDQAVYQCCEELGVASYCYHEHAIQPPGAVLTQQNTPFSVFTPFSKRWLANDDQIPCFPLPVPPAPASPLAAEDLLPVLEKGFELAEDKDVCKAGPFALEPLKNDREALHGLWPAGEREASQRLDAFVAEKLDRYLLDRDFPARPASSCLSPYLALGVLSARECLIRAKDALQCLSTETQSAERENVRCWINELIWRDFYIHVLALNVRISQGKAFRATTEGVPWREDEAGFTAWCEGRTGIPIVDAAMRQLLATGWMHNRLRMICAMFLTKNLLIDWRKGEAFFMRHLIDGHFAANNGGWQWSASTGTDAAPYFRIFNPVTQSQRFDPHGVFIREYLPELRDLSDKDLHFPPPLLREALSYPQAIVDLKASRLRAIDTFKEALG
jgi:deoxyribodipyrimidine photo-lyase